ncbi:MAG: Uma2 family endonuclease [Gemmatimonadaceae bacterium]
MLTQPYNWTADDLDLLPDDGNRYEVVDGELFVTPAPSFAHQRVMGAIYTRLYAFVANQKRFAWVMFAPGDVHMDTKNQVQPDIFVVPRTAAGIPATWREAPRPILVVEVLSSTTARRDRGPKRELYMRARIGEYWIVDHKKRSVVIVRRGEPDVEASDLVTWSPAGASEPLVIDLPALFREALDD